MPANTRQHATTGANKRQRTEQWIDPVALILDGVVTADMLQHVLQHSGPNVGMITVDQLRQVTGMLRLRSKKGFGANEVPVRFFSPIIFINEAAASGYK